MSNSRVLEYILRVKDEATKEVNTIADNIGAKLGVSGSTVKMAAAGFTAVGTAIGVAGKIAFDVGKQYDEASSIIVKGTGAQGEALRDLEEAFRRVHLTVPQASQEVATAIAEVNTRLGVTGEELENASKLMLDFARVSSNEVGPTAQVLGRLFNALEIDASDLESVMDKLTYASQKTGIEALSLANNIIDAGPAFEELGFGLEESIALFSQFEAAGARPQEVISSMNLLMNNFARQGAKDGKEAMDMLMESIKEAPDIFDATRIAAEYFGSRVGSKVAEDMRAGRFEIEDFVGELQNVNGTLRNTADESMELGEKWDILKKRATDLLQPVGVWMVDAMSNAMDSVMNFSMESSGLGEAWLGLVDVYNAYLKPSIDELWGVISTELIPTLQELWTMIAPVLIPVLKQLALIAGATVVVGIRAMIEVVKYLVDWMTRAVKVVTSFVNILRSLPDLISGAMDKASDLLDKLNPFHRESPSLVDNVLAGVKLIRKEYEGLADMNLPSVSGAFAPANGGVVNNHSFQAPITINAPIHTEMDAHELAHILGFELQMRSRG